MSQPCPCGSTASYEICCGRFHHGAKPETAEQLMRSRYSAYALKCYDYIVATTHPNHRQGLTVAEIQQWADRLLWQKLEIISTSMGKAGDKTGKVEFRATYLSPDSGLQVLVEHSRFKRYKGHWYYLDAI